MDNFATYAFEDEKVIAFHDNQVIASGVDFAKVSETAEEYFNTLRSERERKTAEVTRREATHITTPNGEKGVILGRTAALFADDGITVRFANGQIRHYDTFVGDGLTFSKEAADAPKSPVEYFQRQLDEAPVPGRNGLVARLEVLDAVRRNAAHLASQGVSLTDGQELHKIVLTADAERNEVQEALDYLVTADAEAMAPPKQAYTAVEQAPVGHSDSWLEVVAQEMIAESESQDYDKLLVEGPTEFVAGLEIGALGHTGVVLEMARDFVTARTAGFQGDAVDQYRDRFVANAELARRRELTYRKDAANKEVTQREASIADVPDEAMFL